MRRTFFLLALLGATLLGPFPGQPSAHADVLSHPFLTWTIYPGGKSYLSPVKHLHLDYGTALVGSDWYFTIQVVNLSGAPLHIDRTTGLGATAYYRAPQYCHNQTCYYTINFEPPTITIAEASATVYLHAHKSGCSSCWVRSAPIQLVGKAIEPRPVAPSWGQVCGSCGVTLVDFPSRLKVQLKSHSLHGGTVRLAARPEPLFNSPLGFNRLLASRLTNAHLNVALVPMRNGDYSIFSRGYWVGFLQPPWHWDLDHWLTAHDAYDLVKEIVEEVH